MREHVKKVSASKRSFKKMKVHIYIHNYRNSYQRLYVNVFILIFLLLSLIIIIAIIVFVSLPGISSKFLLIFYGRKVKIEVFVLFLQKKRLT